MYKIASTIFLFFVLWVFVPSAFAGAFFETGQSVVNPTIDSSSANWLTVTTQKTYKRPVIIASLMTHNNGNSLSVRVRSVGSNSFQIGLQSPCESYNRYNNTTPPPNNRCPVSPWQAETVQWMVIEEGTWIFPDGKKVEAYKLNSNTVRSKIGNNSNAATVVNYSHTYATAPIVLHTVNTFNDSNWISSTVWGRTGGRGQIPNTTGFRIALEGAEATASHGSEAIGWVAIELGSGTNMGNQYVAFKSPGLTVDRHNDGCYSVNYGLNFNAVPNAVVQHNTMKGGDGAWVRGCAAIQTNRVRVHMEEDQVSDTERTGVPESVAGFAFTNGSVGALEFLLVEKSTLDTDVGPGSIITYSIYIENLQDDFEQPDNPSSTEPEFVDVLDSTLEFDSIVSASSGTLTFNPILLRFEWNGSIPAEGVVELEYTVRVKKQVGTCVLTNIPNQAQFNMDPSRDSAVNDIVELSNNDPFTDDGVDLDGDGLTDDDDPTLVPVACSSDLSVSKTDTVANYTPGESSTHTITVTNAGPHHVVGATITDNLPNGVAINGAVTCNFTGVGICGTQTIVGNDISQAFTLEKDAVLTLTVPILYSNDPSNY